jgi:hypothetical protein
MVDSPVMRWRLKKYLAEKGVTPYQVAQKMGGNVRGNQSLMYRLQDGDVVTSTVPTIERIVFAIRELTGEEVRMFDLVEEVYEHD